MWAPMAVGVLYTHPWLRWGREEQKTALQKGILIGGLHSSTKKADKAKYSNLRGIPSHSGASMGAPMAMSVQYGHPCLRWGRNEPQTTLNTDIFMEGSHTRITRQTEQNAETFGVSLVVLKQLRGPLWPWVCNMPIQDWDEVGKSKKTLYVNILLQKGCKQAS